MRRCSAAAEKKTSFVTQLVAAGAASARDIAVAAASEFGVPLFDLDALDLDLETVKLGADKLLAKHRVLPLFRRGKRLFLGVADPTNLHAIDEIKFQTGLGVEAIVVEDDKLQKILDKAIEQVDTSMPNLGDDEASTSTRWKSAAAMTSSAATVSRDDVEDAPIVRFVNKIMLDAIRRGASDIHFEPYEKIYRVRLRIDGVLKEIAQPPVQLASKISRAPQGHVAARHRRAPRAAGRPHQDAPVEEPRHRLPREHLPDAVRREDRAAYPRPLAGACSASTRWATSRSSGSCT